MTTAPWIAIALLTPFWWGLVLFILAWLGDVSRPLRPRVSRLFGWLERTREVAERAGDFTRGRRMTGAPMPAVAS